MYSVFVGLRLSLLILVHSAIFDNSTCAVSLSSAWLFEDIVISVSSAYMLALECSRQCLKSFKINDKEQWLQPRALGNPTLSFHNIRYLTINGTVQASIG